MAEHHPTRTEIKDYHGWTGVKGPLFPASTYLSIHYNKFPDMSIRVYAEISHGKIIILEAKITTPMKAQVVNGDYLAVPECGRKWVVLNEKATKIVVRTGDQQSETSDFGALLTEL